ncbi:sulfate adenylyltransferase subunit CysN [Sandaracinobacter sp. RS1-74]|uniref:sulfate adenylyltransferase subunit CysN n=1 Tax=Sandaracinobacteroides sayramensis TaxID=2913411 RepID=UPI001EDA29D2|nr:sulfate adenylyltransferase subunit CysN [Sandaracinobacteroides sayramensis]MCG2841741.1 sulfate adenylyltransferase subunit CysN [Sandaracinobacteroides sayramensis]
MTAIRLHPEHAEDVSDFLDRQARLPTLRFITCGSVDDGKSTLIGRLLHDSKALVEGQIETLAADSARHGTRGKDMDFALLVDGLAAEREQGITIDVAYRFFASPNRRYIVADCPGHEQYTRNMATGASTADLAVLLVDASRGLLQQTRRHAFIVSQLGIRQLVLAVNKMDLAGHSEARFRAIEADFRKFAATLGFADITAIPIIAPEGANIATRAPTLPWYKGPTLVEALETAETNTIANPDGPARLPVQWVNRPDSSFRGFAGQIASGTFHVGQKIRVLPAGRDTRIARILGPSGDLSEAIAGTSVTFTLADEVDVSRGDVLAGADRPADVADQFEATLIWMEEAPLYPGRPYWLKLGTRTVGATVTAIKQRIDMATLEPQPAKALNLNDIAVVTLALDRPIAFDPYSLSRLTGGFILIDRLSNATAGAGTVRYPLTRASTIRWQALDVSKATRAALNGQRPMLLWFTGLSGAGKSTIANLVEKKLHAMGKRTYLLDGDNVRHGLNRDLGFTEADRVENIRRIAEVGKLMVDAGLIVLTAFISPFRAERQLARDLQGKGEFVEIFIDTPLAEAERRDVKGLYARARAGEIRNFTGIDSPYEPPENPDLHIDTTQTTPEQAAEQIVAHILHDEIYEAWP